MDSRRASITDILGAEVIERSDGRAVMRFPVLPAYTNYVGQLQGGMFAVMMDAAMSTAAGGIATATLQYSIFRPATEGFLIVTGEVIRRGRRIIYAEASVHDEQGRLVARGNQHGLPGESAGAAAE